jgi:hypothetical protein
VFESLNDPDPSNPAFGQIAVVVDVEDAEPVQIFQVTELDASTFGELVRRISDIGANLSVRRSPRTRRAT